MGNGVCGFTGHRSIEKEHISRLPDLLGRAIEYAYLRGCRTFISGGAVGFDIAAARAVLQYRISHPDVSLVMYLPCIGQDEKWSESQQNAYNYVLKAANEVVYLSDSYTSNCMMIRNRAIANDSDIIISYVSRDRSGAAQTVRMAQRRGKEVYNLYPTLSGKADNTAR